MRIVIDMQGCQFGNRFTGKGRYVKRLVRALLENRGRHEIILALNGSDGESIDEIRAFYDDLTEQKNIQIWRAVDASGKDHAEKERRRKISESIREEFLSSRRPDAVLVSGLFDGFGTGAIYGDGLRKRRYPVFLLLFDFFLYVNKIKNEETPELYDLYFGRKFRGATQATHILTVSEYASDLWRSALSSTRSHFTNISLAGDPAIRRKDATNNEAKAALNGFGITDSFLLCSAGGGDRSGLFRLFGAYASLPESLRERAQIVVNGAMSESEISALRSFWKGLGLGEGRAIYVNGASDDELSLLYNACSAYAAIHSDECFSVSTLEAMSCGAATVGSKTGGVAELLSNPEALFDPKDESSIAAKLEKVLTDSEYRKTLSESGYERSREFSWSRCAERTFAALESAIPDGASPLFPEGHMRPRLAFVSPMPPLRTGIADFSAELLPELAKIYDITLIVEQETVNDPWALGNCEIRDVEWLRNNQEKIHRILYHVGNSEYHKHMLTMLGEFPGVVVQHDFFMGHLLEYLQNIGYFSNSHSSGLYRSHGYAALREKYHPYEGQDIAAEYPANMQIFQNALGVIVHSEYARNLACQWYGDRFAENWKCIPLLRQITKEKDQYGSRKELDLNHDDFVVCSFGYITEFKLTHRIVDAWLNSTLADDEKSVFVIAGESPETQYVRDLKTRIETSGAKSRIILTGWIEMSQYRNYLAAADAAVQLRTKSRGETSAAILDCLNYSLATIVNANGAMADIDREAVWMLEDEFAEKDLIEALERLRGDENIRKQLGTRARDLVRTQHSPGACARKYAEAIEEFYEIGNGNAREQVRSLLRQAEEMPSEKEFQEIASCLVETFPPPEPKKRLFLDVSGTARNDLRTGIERVARALAVGLLEAAPDQYRVEPVYLNMEGDRWTYKYAREFTLHLLDCPTKVLADEIATPRAGDIVLGLDLSGGVLLAAARSGLFDSYRRAGVKTYFIVYDLLPLKHPLFFPPGADQTHGEWIDAVSRFDGAFCISRSVASDLESWMEAHRADRKNPYKIGWFHLGADIENSAPSSRTREEGHAILARMKERISFVMVGTLEPRKGHLQTLRAFSLLWDEGLDVNLIIAGREGWRGLAEDMRRTIPEITSSIRSHSESGKRLFWVDDAEDDDLMEIYRNADCLIAGSEDEGFGLPLIEAARYETPIFARDIPVFREVAGAHAYYFKGADPESLAHEIKDWLGLYAQKRHPESRGLRGKTWRESIDMLLSGVFSSAETAGSLE